ncbi:MAG: 30S ribosomal protein S3 [Firmicutes bacterium]|nr:30S ribosomal protein S3 [Bacillota bacterium]
MGQKIHPIGFRIGVIRDWESKWYADQDFDKLLQEDEQIRTFIRSRLRDAAVSTIEIERAAARVNVVIHTAKPGMVIGKGGSEVENLRRALSEQTGKRVHIDIAEIRHPELDAQLVAEGIAQQIERRVSYRRAMKQAIQRTIRAGAKGIRTNVAGRLGGAEIARREWYVEGTVPMQTLRADIDFGFAEARTTYGRIGVKVWIYRGDVLPERKATAARPAETEVVQ